MLRELGSCERVPCSGNARAFKGDLVFTLPSGERFHFEVKARKSGFKQLYDFFEKASSIYISGEQFSSNIYKGLMIKVDRKQPLIILDFETFRRILEKQKSEEMP